MQPRNKVKLTRVREEAVEDKGLEGLRDAGHVMVCCSNCRAALVDIWRTRPHEAQNWKVRAKCPFCGDKSFIVDIQGGFHQGGVAVSREDEPDEDLRVSTVVENWEIVNDVFEFNVKKASQDAKPYYPGR